MLSVHVPVLIYRWLTPPLREVTGLGVLVLRATTGRPRSLPRRLGAQQSAPVGEGRPLGRAGQDGRAQAWACAGLDFAYAWRVPLTMGRAEPTRLDRPICFGPGPSGPRRFVVAWR